MKNFVDIHNHSAWNVDDGIESFEQAKASLLRAKEDGIEAIVSTPHYIPGRFSQIDVDEITNRQKELIALGKEIGVQIYMGAEVFLNQDYLDMFDKHLFHPIADGKYVLVEFDVRKNMDDNEDAEDMLYEIKYRGFIPIIAHVERYFHDGVDIERVMDWVDEGYIVQVNRTSLLKKGSTSQSNAFNLIENNLVHLVATDTHQVEGARKCIMSDVYEMLASEFGDECAEILCCENPKRVILNEKLIETEVVKKKTLWSRLFRKG